MIRAIHVIAATFALTLIGFAAGAQTRGAASVMRIPSVHMASVARPAVSFTAGSRTVQPTRVMQISASGRVIPITSSFANSVNFGVANGVPGLGFDYPHLAAISGSLRNNGSFSSRRGGHLRQNSFVPILFGGYPYYPNDSSIDSSDYDQPQPQPQVIVIQQPVPAMPVQQDVASADNAASPSMPPAATPVRDVGDFVLVRRDGRILFASIFSVAGHQLVYVTPEGIRHALPLTELDTDATQEMNEARGTTVQLHN